MNEAFQIITFYEFKPMKNVGDLTGLRDRLKAIMAAYEIKGTIILAEEGFNSTVCGRPEAIKSFVSEAGAALGSEIVYKSSFHATAPFRKIDVKIKPEIVTLKRRVDLKAGIGTHVPPSKWNDVISDPATIVLDTRNDYEFKEGTFRRAINPGTEKFSDLPSFVEKNLDPAVNQKIAVFCTGGIRCEKFAPYLVELGFREVFQLEGGILKYIETVPSDESMWEGECFVFDDRRTVDNELKPGKTSASVSDSQRGSE